MELFNKLISLIPPVHDDEDDPFPGEAEAGPHIRIRDVFRSHNDNGHNDSGYDHG